MQKLYRQTLDIHSTNHHNQMLLNTHLIYFLQTLNDRHRGCGTEAIKDKKAIGSSSILQFGCSTRASQTFCNNLFCKLHSQTRPWYSRLIRCLAVSQILIWLKHWETYWLLGLIDFCKNRKLLWHFGSFLSWPFPSNINMPLAWLIF